MENIEFPCLPHYRGPISGFFFCVHHSSPVFEWSNNIMDRVQAYNDGLKEESELPLRRSHLLYIPEIVIPEVYKAYEAYFKAREAYSTKASKAYFKAYEAYDKASKAYDKAYEAYDKASKAYDKAYEAYYYEANESITTKVVVIFYARAKIKNFSYELGKGLLFP